MTCVGVCYINILQKETDIHASIDTGTSTQFPVATHEKVKVAKRSATQRLDSDSFLEYVCRSPLNVIIV